MRIVLQSYKSLLNPILVFVSSCTLIIILSFVSASGLPNGMNAGVYPWVDYDAEWQEKGYPSLWYRWDTMWYLDVAENGYYYDDEIMSSVSFFPVYPLLIKVFMLVTPNPLIAAMVISITCFLLSLIMLYRLTLLETDSHEISLRATFMLAFFPTAIFLFAPYTESLFLLLSLIVAYETRSKRYWSAGIVGAIASAIRIPGILLAVFVFIEWLQAWRENKASWREFIPIMLMPIGLAMYLGYLAVQFGNPLAFVASTSNSTTDLGAGPLSALVREIGKFLSGRENYLLNVPMGLFALILGFSVVYPVAKNIRLSYAVYIALSLLLPFWGGPIVGIMRFTVVLFPIFMMLAIWGRHKWVNLIYATLSLTMFSVYILLYIRGFFLG